MKVNERICIIGDDVVLVPYRPEHVLTYHNWMKNDALRELTASEPLSLDEEYEMQKNWQIDEDIARNANSTSDAVAEETDLEFPSTAKSAMAILTNEAIKTLPMVGDVNLFLKGAPTEEDFEAEVEIMIAEPAYHRRGLAYSALQLFLSYATSPLLSSSSSHSSQPPSPQPDRHSPLPVPRNKFVARIGDSNTPSVRLFEKLGFAVTKHVAVFGELELRPTAEEAGMEWRAGEVRTFD